MRLPPYGRALADMVGAGRRPQIFGGAIVAALDWDVAKAWPRFVLPATDDPRSFRLDFCRGLDVLVFYRPEHDAAIYARDGDLTSAQRATLQGCLVTHRWQQ